MSETPNITTNDLVNHYSTLGSGIIGLIFLTPLVVLHFYYFYLDFYTEARNSVTPWTSTRRDKPAKTGSYTAVSTFTLLTVALGTIACLALILYESGRTFTYDTNAECEVGLMFVFWSIHLTKFFLYFTFLARLQSVFGPSPFGYDNFRGRALIAGLRIFVVVVTIAFLVTEFLIYIGNYGGALAVVQITNKVGCLETDLVPLAIAYALFDLIVNVLLFVLFYRPLSKILKTVEKNASKKIMTEKMLYYAVKVSILTWVASVTTVVQVGIGAPTNFWLVGIDLAVTSYCIAFMTPYYRDDFWFLRYCGVCILCCDNHHYIQKKLDNQEKRRLLKENVPSGLVAAGSGDASDGYGVDLAHPSLETDSVWRMAAQDASKSVPQPGDNAAEVQMRAIQSQTAAMSDSDAQSEDDDVKNTDFQE